MTYKIIPILFSSSLLLTRNIFPFFLQQFYIPINVFPTNVTSKCNSNNRICNNGRCSCKSYMLTHTTKEKIFDLRNSRATWSFPKELRKSVLCAVSICAFIHKIRTVFVSRFQLVDFNDFLCCFCAFISYNGHK